MCGCFNQDHPLHEMFILAGLWGFRVELDRKLGRKLFQAITTPKMSSWYEQHAHEKQADQIFLNERFRRHIERNLTAHDSFHCSRFGLSRAFPKQRPVFYCHVGGYGCCGPEFSNSSFPHECPYECRPPDHKEWIFC